MSEELLKPERQLKNGVWHTVHVSSDRSVQIDTGRDDNRPDHDGQNFFTPICVAHMIGETVYRYVKYCGHCNQKMEGLTGNIYFCPRCGSGIGHYIFAMGVHEFRGTHMPDVWIPGKLKGLPGSRVSDSHKYGPLGDDPA